MVIKIRIIPLFERGDHAEFKYIIRTDFLLFWNTKKWRSLGQKLTSDHQTNNFIWFLDHKNKWKVVPFIILIFLVFSWFKNIKKYIFDPWAESEPTYSWWKLGVLSTPYNLLKKHYKPLFPWGEVPPTPSWLLDYKVLGRFSKMIACFNHVRKHFLVQYTFFIYLVIF